ncbi:beta-hydroxyacid dehydrogenase [Nakamurella endophytica]|uniref:Beta-hydroxyacid dehydrogenase n=1 Tax=Nakamurella endophytica TaxID=1748367 RepID=A0A917SRZ3_9ACTN|nr:NAD(P)-dependent oxidoreductase [Nakamurella endophytica]GGL94629.1 beta-hydroxyacid dehydrogenase [Nakamurella endophytica]
MTRVGVIGLGAMGLPMARRLSDTGFQVVGFDPSGDRRALAGSGGVPAVATAAAAGDADVLLLAVRDGAQAEQALFGPDGAAQALPARATVVLTSTIGSTSTGALAERIATSGRRFVDAPVSGGPTRAGSGDLLVLVGGAPDDVRAAEPVLQALASTLTVVGSRPGDGQLVKVINQLLAGVHIAAAAEAVALARGAGLDPAVVVDVLSAGAAGSFMLRDRGPRMLEQYGGSAAPEVRSRVDIFVKDMALVAELARDRHVPVPLAAAAQQLYLLAEAAGLGAEDDSSVVTVLSPADRSAPS